MSECLYSFLLLMRHLLLFQICFQEQLQELLFYSQYVDINLNNVSKKQSWSLMGLTSFFLLYKRLYIQSGRTTTLLGITCHKKCFKYYKKYLREKDLKTTYTKMQLDEVLIQQIGIPVGNVFEELSISCLPQSSCSQQP